MLASERHLYNFGPNRLPALVAPDGRRLLLEQYDRNESKIIMVERSH